MNSTSKITKRIMTALAVIILIGALGNLLIYAMYLTGVPFRVASNIGHMIMGSVVTLCAISTWSQDDKKKCFRKDQEESQ